MIALLRVPNPTEAYRSSLPLLREAAGMRPVSFVAMLTEVLGLPAVYSPNLDLAHPIVGVLVEGDPMGLALAIHVNNGREMVAALSTGRSPSHRARVMSGGLTLLEPLTKSPALALSLGVIGNALVVGVQGVELEVYAPHLRVQLSAAGEHPGPAPPLGALEIVVPGALLRGVAAGRIEAEWKDWRGRLEGQALELRDKRGREADFASPAAVLDGADELVGEIVRVARSAQGARVLVELQPHAVAGRLELESGDKGAARELVHGLAGGDVNGLLALPRGVGAGCLFRSTAKGRLESSHRAMRFADKLFGSRLDAPSRTVLDAAMSATARGRGDDLVVGLIPAADGWVVVASATVVDDEALDRGVRGILRSLSAPAFAEPLVRFLGRPHVGFDTAQIPEAGGTASRARIRWERPSAPNPPTDVLWRIESGRLMLAVGPSAADGLVALIEAASDPAASLAARDDVQAGLARAGDEVAMACFWPPTHPSAAMAGGPPAPAVLSVGRAAKRAMLRLELPTVDLLALFREQR